MEEREIDLLDMVADILSHWRGLLVAVMIGAFLMGGLSYVKSYRNVKNTQMVEETGLEDETVEKQLEQLEEDLDESQRAAVLTIIDDEREFVWKDKYSREATSMQIDPLNVAQRQLVYQIKTVDDNQHQRLGAVYGDILNNVGLYNWVEEKTGIPAADVGTLVLISATSSTPFVNGELTGVFGTDSLKITVIQSDDESCKKLTDEVKSYVEQQRESLIPKVGEHELILLSESAGTVVDTGLMDRQVSYGNVVNSLRSTIASAKVGFSEDQQKYYDLLTREEIDKEEVDQKDITENQPEIAVPSVSKKYTLLGAFLFVFVYAGILFVVYLFNSKLRVSDELQNLYHIPQIGVVVKDSKKKHVDKWIDDLRNYGKRKFTAEQSMELAFVAVKIAAIKNKLNDICLMGCNLGAGADTVCANLKSALEKEGINVTVLDNVLYNAESMEKVDGMTGIVLVEKAGSTLYSEIASELALLKRQGIEVLGGIIVE